jgi:hypothetical protein
LDPFIIVKVDIFIDDLVGFLKTRDRKLPQGFFLQVSEEVLHRCIIPAIAAAGHGRGDGIILSQDSIPLRSVLLPLVTKQQSRYDLFVLLGLFESIKDYTE